MSKPQTFNLLGNQDKGVKIHDLVKAPANTPWAIANNSHGMQMYRLPFMSRLKPYPMAHHVKP